MNTYGCVKSFVVLPDQCDNQVSLKYGNAQAGLNLAHKKYEFCIFYACLAIITHLREPNIIIWSHDLCKVHHPFKVWLCCLSKMHHIWLNIGLMLYFELYAPDVSKKYLQILFFFIQILFFVKTKMKIIIQGQIQTYHQNSIEPNMVHFTQVLNSVTRLYVWLFGLKKY